MSARAPCKCCGGRTEPFGTVDAARSCEDRRGGAVFPPSLVPVAYLRCTACDLVFTTDLDGWSEAEMAARIYNTEYVQADPDFATTRPTFFAGLLAGALRPLRETVDILDYGGGDGRLSRLLGVEGFRCDSFDPFFGGTMLAPHAYDLVTAFEVVEHSRTPLETFRAMREALRPGGTLVFSTRLRPRRAGIEWWYVAPRNGHVTLHSPGSLHACARVLGMRFVPLGEGLHLFCADAAAPAAATLMGHFAASAVYVASLQGWGEWLRTARALLSGPPAARRAALSLRAPLRLARAALLPAQPRG